jgi:hypothetical protein
MINSICEDENNKSEDTAIRSITHIFKSMFSPSTAPSTSSSTNIVSSMLPQSMQMFCNQTENSVSYNPVSTDNSGYLITPEKLIKFFEPLINQTSVQKIQTVYELHVKNRDTDRVDIIFLNLKHGCGSSGFGKFDSSGMNADCTIKLSVHDLNEILLERLSPFNAYMHGNIEVDGNLQDVIKLKTLLSSAPSISKLVDI